VKAASSLSIGLGLPFLEGIPEPELPHGLIFFTRNGHWVGDAPDKVDYKRFDYDKTFFASIGFQIFPCEVSANFGHSAFKYDPANWVYGHRSLAETSELDSSFKIENPKTRYLAFWNQFGSEETGRLLQVLPQYATRWLGYSRAHFEALIKFGPLAYLVEPNEWSKDVDPGDIAQVSINEEILRLLGIQEKYQDSSLHPVDLFRMLSSSDMESQVIVSKLHSGTIVYFPDVGERAPRNVQTIIPLFPPGDAFRNRILKYLQLEGLDQLLWPGYFEVTVLEGDSANGFMATGLAMKPYSSMYQTGWDFGSIAFHSDDGKIFQGGGQSGIVWESSGYGVVGDVVGVGMNNEGDVFFTRNGERIGPRRRKKSSLKLAADMDVEEDSWEIGLVPIAKRRWCLFPTISACAAWKVRLNFGEHPFKYEEANSRRWNNSNKS
ncbi:Rsp5p-dependent ubiquitination, sorting of cargo proteins at the multivesicular body, partial [Blyttiomyces sp. JEL0837]